MTFDDAWSSFGAAYPIWSCGRPLGLLHVAGPSDWTNLIYGYALASLFRNAFSPASDTSTHFLSGAESAT
jgi:hypothetical protein